MEEKRYRHRMQREILKEFLCLPCDDAETVQVLESMGLEASFANAVNLAILRRAVRGEADSLRYIRDTLGEKNPEATGAKDAPAASFDLKSLTDEELLAMVAEEKGRRKDEA